MIRELLEAVSRTLHETFGDGYAVYAENVEQGLREPCFFLSCLAPASRPFPGNRYLRTNQLCVQYFPADRKHPNRERLLDCLELLPTADGLVRGTQLHAEFADGVLHVFVNYDFFVRRENETTDMGVLSTSVTAKGAMT